MKLRSYKLPFVQWRSEKFQKGAISCKNHQNNLAYFNHFASFDLFLLKGKDKKGGGGMAQCPSSKYASAFIQCIFFSIQKIVCFLTLTFRQESVYHHQDPIFFPCCSGSMEEDSALVPEPNCYMMADNSRTKQIRLL